MDKGAFWVPIIMTMTTVKSAHASTSKTAAPTGISADGPSPMQDIQEANFKNVHNVHNLKLPQLHMFGRR